MTDETQEPQEEPNTRILANGAVYDMDKKRIVANPGGGTGAITQSNASALARLRWERSREEFAAGMAEGMKVQAPTQAWRKIGKKAVELLEQSTGARGFADLARFAGEAGGFVPMARGREEMQEQQQEQPQIVVMILQYLSTLQPPSDVIDGEIKD